MLIDQRRDTADDTDTYQPPPTHPVALGVALGLLVLVSFFGMRWWVGEAGFGAVSGASARVPVPDVVGLSEAAARSALERAGLEIELEPVRNVLVPAGTVFAQLPDDGLEVEPGATVVVRVSVGDGVVLVPEITGTSEEQLAEQLARHGLVVGEVTRREDRTSLRGEVLQQTPPPGQQVERGSAVDVVISDGPPPVEVPDVVGLTEAEATRQLVGLGFTVSPVRVYSGGRVGNVVSTNPRAGTEAEYGTAIRLFVSRGAAPTTVPPPSDGDEPDPTAPTPPTTPTTTPTTPPPATPPATPPGGGPGGGGPGGGGPGGGGPGGGGPGGGEDP